MAVKTYIDTVNSLTAPDSQFPDAYLVIQHGLGESPTEADKYAAMKKLQLSVLKTWLEDVMEISSVVYGYYYNELFYSDLAHTSQITPDTNSMYVDISTDEKGIYRYSTSLGYLLITEAFTTVLKTKLNEHVANNDIHVTTVNKTAWNAKYDKPYTGIPRSDLSTELTDELDSKIEADDEELDTTIPLNADTLNGYNAAHFNDAIDDLDTRLDSVEDNKVDKVAGSVLVPDTKVNSYDAHIVNSDIHVTTANKAAWNAKYDKPSNGIPKSDLAPNVLSSYSVISETGYTLNLEMDSSTFVITPKMYDKNGNLISEGTAVDLPMESVVVDGSYDAANKKIILTLKNGSTVDIPVGDLISGLATQSWVEGKGYLVASDIINKVDKVDGSSLVPDTKVAGYDTHVADGTIHVTSDNKSTWDAKYDKPTGGIPKTDLASEVQTSLGKADSAIQSIKTINNQSLVGSGNIILLSTSDEALN